MNDIIVTETDSETSGQRSQPVLEEPWTDSIEELIYKWREHAVTSSELHEKAAYSIKIKHNVFGLPPVLVPLTMTFVSQIIPEEKETFTSGLMFLISGVSGAIYKWLNLGELYTLHFQYAARYDDIITSIDSELSRQKKFRRAADAFVTELRAKIDNLNQTAPDFPICSLNFNCCCNYNTDEVKTTNIDRSETEMIIVLEE